MSSASLPARGNLPPEEVLRFRVKAETRKRLRALRKTTPASACAERSARIVERLESLPFVQAAGAVALFWPIEERHEVDLRPMDARLRARRVRVAYPTILEPEGDDGPGRMVFRYADPEGLVDHPLGFRAPPPGAGGEAGDLDVIVVPAIAVDPTGHRIGYGAGYYDRALAERRGPVTVAVAYDFQLIPEVPATPGDVPVQWIVTDCRLLEASPEAALAAPRSLSTGTRAPGGS